MLVAGNTSTGIFKTDIPNVLINVDSVPELHFAKVNMCVCIVSVRACVRMCCVVSVSKLVSGITNACKCVDQCGFCSGSSLCKDTCARVCMCAACACVLSMR